MREVLATDSGGGLYRRRKVMVEPVFAQTKHNRRINQFAPVAARMAPGPGATFGRDLRPRLGGGPLCRPYAFRADRATGGAWGTATARADEQSSKELKLKNLTWTP